MLVCSEPSRLDHLQLHRHAVDALVFLCDDLDVENHRVSFPALLVASQHGKAYEREESVAVGVGVVDLQHLRLHLGHPALPEVPECEEGGVERLLRAFPCLVDGFHVRLFKADAQPNGN